jgi:hypothetical protein
MALVVRAQPCDMGIGPSAGRIADAVGYRAAGLPLK